MSREHWADLGETTFVGGTWFLYAIYRVLGRLPFRLCLFPVVFCWWLGSTTARRASLDYLPSEFSRIRLQYNRDVSQPARVDNQVLLQYTLSLGAHGAHQY